MISGKQCLGRSAFAMAIVMASLMAGPAAGDWSYWRGPEQTGMTREAAVVTSWSQDGENLIWKVPVGGRTTPIIMGGRIFLITPVGTGAGLRERVICLEAETGRTLWEHSFNVFDTDVVENRLGWTALVGDRETGYVYAHASGGEFLCYDRDGKLIWKVSMTEEFGRISGYGGRLHTPIIDEDRVIISFMSSSWGDHAKPLHRYVAFDKRTGQVLWWAAPGGIPLDTTYSTPVVAMIDGVRMLIAGNADGNIYGMKARTGESLWSFRLSKRGLNSSVVVDGNYAYIGHSEENISGTEMGRVVCIDATKRGDVTESGEVWRFDGCEVGYASPAIANGRLYAVDNSANLYCLDGKSGKLHWEYNLGRVGKGSPAVTSDGVIYVGEQTGTFHILRDSGDQCVSLDREEFTRPDQAVDEVFGSPAVDGGRVYFMTRYHTYCLGDRDAKVASANVAPLGRDQARISSREPAFLQLIPGEITLVPGNKATFTLKYYDHAGQECAGSVPQWSVIGVSGVISPDGVFTTVGENTFSAGHLVARSGSLEAKARVRICPSLPFTENFEKMPDGGVPPGWLGVTRKTKIVLRDGSKVLQKLAEDPSPPFMRIKGYMTPPIAGGYTIEADMLGTPKGDRFRPDMGLINSRYEMTLMGVSNELRIESWTPIPRIRKDVSFAWDTDKWYRMKLQVKVDADQALVRGKVWPRDSAEPEAWSIELADPNPNREGSPGVYGYSPGTTAKSKGPELFFDNVKVMPNE